jgi:membrane protease subunit (stomatin/prohibitin family)
MSLGDFLRKQAIDIIQWTEPDNDTLSYRFPMQDMEIQNGAQLTVRESQMAAFVNLGRMVDVFAPGLYTLTTQNLPLLTDLMHWNMGFKSPFKSDVYFFSTRIKTDQRWGTATPITIRDREFGAVRIRGYGIYSWHVADPRTFHTKVSGTRDVFRVADIEGQLRNSIVGSITAAFASSGVPFLDMAANQIDLGNRVAQSLAPMFAELGLALDSFGVESLSLPEELQKMLDTRVSMNMIGDLSRYTQFQVANSLPIAAANEGGGVAGIGMGLGAGYTIAQHMVGAMQPYPPQTPQVVSPQAAPPPAVGPAPLIAASGGSPAAGGSELKFCVECGKQIARKAKFCPECGGAQ